MSLCNFSLETFDRVRKALNRKVQVGKDQENDQSGLFRCSKETLYCYSTEKCCN